MAITLLNNGLDIEALPLSVRLRKPHEFPMATHDAQVQLAARSRDNVHALATLHGSAASVALQRRLRPCIW